MPRRSLRWANCCVGNAQQRQIEADWRLARRGSFPQQHQHIEWRELLTLDAVGRPLAEPLAWRRQDLRRPKGRIHPETHALKENVAIAAGWFCASVSTAIFAGRSAKHRQQRVDRPAVQADDAGVVPTFLEPGKGELDRGNMWQKSQLIFRKRGQQRCPDAVEQRIARGQHDRLSLSRGGF